MMKRRHQNDTDTNTDTDTDTDTEDSDSIEVNVAKELCVKRKRKDKKEKECSGNVDKLEGRHCELCGGGSDGNPPLISSKDMSLNELDGFSCEDGWLGRLITPIVDRHGIPRTWVHYQCILWTPEVHLTDSGSWKNVEAALTRGKSLKCSHCKKRSATLGCRIKKCRRTYHLACARFNGCQFDHKEFLMACPKHLHMFQQPHSDNLKSNKTKLGSDKNKDFESNDDDDDDGKNKDGKFGNIVPTFVGGTHGEKDHDKYFGLGGWESVGGLQEVIECMKEVVTIPLMYPEFFEKYAITPPRGVLLHGYPGTGKTHVVRALVGSCARGRTRIAYFSCKGADCLGKYVGDSEKHLKQLFEAAERCQPSIIFFDEIDGLVPSRNNKEQDQTHTSVVSTLLALLDGIKPRGCVVVIGATNRPDAIDSALRRPGRFDREIYFPLPSLEDRISILSLYTQKWPKAVLKPNLLQWIARKTSGFAGADLQGLCVQTAMIALNRNFSVREALSKVDLHYDNRRLDLPVDVVVVEERDWLKALSTCPPPCSRRDQLLVVANDMASSLLPSHLISCLFRPLSTLLVLLYLEETICLPNTLCKDATIIESAMVSALKRKKVVMDRNNTWWFHVDDLLKDDEVANEIRKKWEEAPRSEGIEDSSFANENNAKQRKSFILENTPWFGILIAGNPKCGQRHLASYIINSYIEHVEIRKLDLIQLVSQDYTNLEQGVAITVADFVSRGSCLIFMPRIDLWAIEAQDLVHPFEEEEEECSSIQTSSCAWKVFTEQVELLCLSKPFVFLATSDVPFLLLPPDIKKFFGNELTNCKLVGKNKHRMPRFSIQVDDSFNHEHVMDQAAEKVSKDLAELFVVLIHQKYHEDHGKDDREEPMKRQILEERGKLLVLEATAAFGNEILQNPKFSPLCVVTSKFKLEESGPCASISKSEWKDLKFNNACVVHSRMEDIDDDELDQTHGRVKGLVAVALLATRGVYTTLQQVCSDVGAIRDELVKKVNAKVDDAGKDRLRYLGVLSQAAWLQDVVDSWAYYYKQKSLKLQDDYDCERKRNGRTDTPSIICSMNCCSGCMKILHIVTRNIIQQRIRSSKKFDGTTESLHDVVMKTWGKLARKVSTLFHEGVKRRRKDVGDENEKEHYKKLVESYGMESCGCKIMRNNKDGMVISSECSPCHSTSRSTTSHEGKYKFVFKNNMLVNDHNQHPPTQDEEDQTSFRCKYDTLCLASIIQPIAKKKKNKSKKNKSKKNINPF